MSVAYQILCTGMVCYLSLNMGLLFAWPSCTAKLFESNMTTLNRPMSPIELNLFGSLSSVGAMISTPVAGYYLDVVGRKKCGLGLSFTYVAGWSMIAISNRVETVLAAVFISGFGAAAMLVVRVFVSEICCESIRGAMTTGSLVFFTTGLLLSYVLGDILQYHAMVYTCLSIAVAGVGLFCLLRESPAFLMKKGLPLEASKSIAFYRRVSSESKIVSDEIEKLRRALHPHLGTDEVDLTAEEQKLKPDCDKSVKKVSLWTFIKKSPATRRAIILTLTLATTGTFQGIVVLQVYAKPLFEQAVPGVSPILCSVLQAIATLISGIVAGFLTDWLGRRVKSIMSMVVIEWSWLCCFIVLFMYKPLVLAIGLGSLFYVFASICMVTCLYAAVYMPETKGLPVDKIEEVFGKRKGFLR